MRFQIAAEPEYDLLSKVGSIDFEYGVRGRELELALGKAQDDFVRAMEMQGLTLFKKAGFPNPVWITNEDGEFTAFYAIDWLGERVPKETRAGGTFEMPHKREMSLEDSHGMVEYRIVGVFWGPKTSIEILKDKKTMEREERLSRNPIQFGPGSTTGKPLPLVDAYGNPLPDKR